MSSPQPYSPASPISSQPTSPKPQRKTDENAPPKPKIISSPKSPQPSKSDGKIRASTPGITKPDKEQNVAKKTETAIKRVQSDADIKTYFSQSELIRPVSVKLENCLLIPEKTLSLLQGMSSQRPIMHMTRYELDGLAMIADWLQSLPINKRIVPRDVPNPDALIMDLRVSKMSSAKYWPFHSGLYLIFVDIMAAISQTTFSERKSLLFPFKFHWSLFLRVHLTISRHWFR